MRDGELHGAALVRDAAIIRAAHIASERGGGLKDDGGKLPWGLLFGGCIRALRGVVGILQFGAKKYKAHSWKEVENGIERYADAQARHWAAIYENGWDARDPETGKLEIDHINCNGMFLGELIRKQYGIKD